MKKKYIDGYLCVRFTVTEGEYNSVANSKDERTHCNTIENLVRRKLECQDYELGDTGYFPDVNLSEDDEFWDTEPFDGYEF